jgi:import inner membrane translocase subunit TIM23
MATAAPNSNDILGNARFSSGGGSRGPSAFGADGAPTASSILGASSIDPSALHPLAGLTNDKAIDYLLLEDEQLNQVQGGKTVMPSRGWGDELCYGTGSSYLAGMSNFMFPIPSFGCCQYGTFESCYTHSDGEALIVQV